MGNQKNLTPEAFQIDTCEWCCQIETFIREQCYSSYRDGIVVPISGGLDSSVVAALCTRAIGNEKVIGLMLPERLGNPEADYYGRMIAEHLNIETMKINISPILRGLRTSNLILSALSGREIWSGIVNRILQKRGRTAERLYLEALKGDLDATSRKLISGVSSKQRARLLVAYEESTRSHALAPVLK